jgi:signal transduction histidine kinase
VTHHRAHPLLESAVYFTVAEALTNVAKHASATSVSVEVEIRDESLADRLAALSGTLAVESPSGEGTTILARIPLASTVV